MSTSKQVSKFVAANLKKLNKTEKEVQKVKDTFIASKILYRSNKKKLKDL